MISALAGCQYFSKESQIMIFRILIIVSLFATNAIAHDCSQFRTPVRSFLQAAPVRSAIQAARPANWRVFNRNRSGCASVKAASCGCSGASASVAVVSRSQPQVAAEVVQATFSATPSEAARTSIGDKLAFRRVFMQAARQARRDGKIDFGDSLKISMLSWIPGGMDKLQTSLADEARASGVVTGAIDWDSLLNFINNLDWAKIIEFISLLMKLFA